MNAQTEMVEREEGALVQTDDPVLQIIQSASANPDVDVEKMERLMQMWERKQAKDAEKAFNRDFIALQNDLPEIDEGGKIIHGGKLISKYARWDEDINPAIKPILALHNFTLSFETDTSDRIRVVAHLIHSDGHSRSGSFTLPPDLSGAKNETQGMGSAVSYAKRYAAAPLLNLIMRGQDDDAAGIERISQSEAADLEALLDEVAKDKADKTKFHAWLKQKRVPDGKIENISKAMYPEILRMLENRRQK